VDAWTDGIGADDEDGPAAFGHITRARRISLWAVSSLIITTVGAIAGIVALVGYDVPAHSGRVVWSRVFGAGAGLLADVVVALAGVLVVRRLMTPDPGEDRYLRGLQESE
jgi:hypothetical protein